MFYSSSINLFFLLAEAFN